MKEYRIEKIERTEKVIKMSSKGFGILCAAFAVAIVIYVGSFVTWIMNNPPADSHEKFTYFIIVPVIMAAIFFRYSDCNIYIKKKR